MNEPATYGNGGDAVLCAGVRRRLEPSPARRPPKFAAPCRERWERKDLHNCAWFITDHPRVAGRDQQPTLLRRRDVPRRAITRCDESPSRVLAIEPNRVRTTRGHS